MAFILIVMGLATSIFYIIITKENYLTDKARHMDKVYKQAKLDQSQISNFRDTTPQPARAGADGKKRAADSMSDLVLDWKGWLSEGSFYIHMVVYMVVRIAVNITMSVKPFYLIYVTDFEQSPDSPTPLPIALVPLVQYTCSLIFSLFFYKRMIDKFKNRFYPLVISVVVLTIGSVPFLFLDGNHKTTNWVVYVASCVQGVGMAIMLNTATSLISDVIGNNEQSSAFVYGAYSFADKVANGILLFFITDLWLNDEHSDAIKYILGCTPIICSIIACFFTYLGRKLYSHRLANLQGSLLENPSGSLLKGEVKDDEGQKI
eukprot:CAMPEP_0170544764 /NCGR_PEP_ID=MMETSP0211-20121228/3401_1 /TAXON_ID=311385 /ORGANISM="Pseudokeronopsis sp., Strain OXSARD2" /LENGTH=317 /DNA_ID=CAMNT_0010848491 /DNA_START=561 /DNA_END=1514 /DNA_ORIENTATION=-